MLPLKALELSGEEFADRFCHGASQSSRLPQ